MTSDLNDAIVPGVYRIGSGGAKNAPSDAVGCYLLVLGEESLTQQVAFRYGYIWLRYKATSGWGNWYKLTGVEVS